MAAAGALMIGALAKRGSVNPQTIRYYERRGLIPYSRRSVAGYRLHGVDAVKRLKFIRRAQQLGFSLSEIEELLSLRMRPGISCAEVREKARSKVASVDAKIAELERIREALKKLAAACREKRPTSACPILEALDRDGD